MSGLTRAVAQFATGTSLGDLGPEAVRMAKWAFIDCIGVAIPGSREQASLIIRKYAQRMGGLAEAESEDQSLFFPAIVTVRLGNGVELTEKVESAKGRWDNPFTQEEFFEKYRKYAGLHLTSAQVEKSLELLDRLETLRDI